MAGVDDEQGLDKLFDQMTVPEGYEAEIVEGTIFMAPQRDVHWQTIRRIVRALEDASASTSTSSPASVWTSPAT